MLLITSWYISLKKKRLRINRRMYKMDEAAFRDLYERVKDVLFAIFLKNISEEEFMDALSNF